MARLPQAEHLLRFSDWRKYRIGCRGPVDGQFHRPVNCTIPSTTQRRCFAWVTSAAVRILVIVTVADAGVLELPGLVAYFNLLGMSDGFTVVQ
jgi:hypothetical protein